MSNLEKNGFSPGVALSDAIANFQSAARKQSAITVFGYPADDPVMLRTFRGLMNARQAVIALGISEDELTFMYEEVVDIMCDNATKAAKRKARAIG